MRYLSLFSGIEAASVAWEPLGWEPVAFCEVDAFPSAVLARRYPDVQNLGDITRVDWSKFDHGEKHPDIIVGGSPCQSFSMAGGREGLAGASGLMFEYIRAVREVRPRIFLWENVPGAFTSDDGDAFRQLLSEMDALGYGLAWRVLDAQFFGVPQRRERVFLVGCLGGPERAAEILFEPESLRWDFAQGKAKREELAARAGRGPAGEGGRGAVTYAVCAEATPKTGAEVCHTLRCGGIGNNVAALPTYCVNSRNSSDVDYATEELSRTVTCGTPQSVAAPVCLGDDNAKAACDVDMCGALKVGGSQPIIGFSTRNSAGPTPADGVAPTLTVGRAGDTACAVAYEVRRLMPVECERLQGFPDGHTDLTGADPDALFERMARDGMDEAERKRLRTRLRKWCKACPDTPRYKACGNSMAVPVMRWIGERIAMTGGGR